MGGTKVTKRPFREGSQKEGGIKNYNACGSNVFHIICLRCREEHEKRRSRETAMGSSCIYYVMPAKYPFNGGAERTQYIIYYIFFTGRSTKMGGLVQLQWVVPGYLQYRPFHLASVPPLKEIHGGTIKLFFLLSKLNLILIKHRNGKKKQIVFKFIRLIF